MVATKALNSQWIAVTTTAETGTSRTTARIIPTGAGTEIAAVLQPISTTTGTTLSATTTPGTGVRRPLAMSGPASAAVCRSRGVTPGAVRRTGSGRMTGFART